MDDILGSSIEPLRVMSESIVFIIVVYMVLPMLALAIVLRFVFRLKGQVFSFLFGILSLAGLWLFFRYGADQLPGLIQHRLSGK